MEFPQPSDSHPELYGPSSKPDVQEETGWAPRYDARTVVAKWSSRCVNCSAVSQVGEKISGTGRDGWACPTCVESAAGRRVRPDWALPVGARIQKARWESLCCLCGGQVKKDDPVWYNVCGGVACDPCKQSVPPTYGGVKEKVRRRTTDGLPVNLNTADLDALAQHVLSNTIIQPVRFGDGPAWAARVGEGRWERVTSLGEAVGILMDALEHGFNPNLRTAWVLALFRAVDDPAGNDSDLERAISRRGGTF